MRTLYESILDVDKNAEELIEYAARMERIIDFVKKNEHEYDMLTAYPHTIEDFHLRSRGNIIDIIEGYEAGIEMYKFRKRMHIAGRPGPNFIAKTAFIINHVRYSKGVSKSGANSNNYCITTDPTEEMCQPNPHPLIYLICYTGNNQNRRLEPVEFIVGENDTETADYNINRTVYSAFKSIPRHYVKDYDDAIKYIEKKYGKM